MDGQDVDCTTHWYDSLPLGSAVEISGAAYGREYHLHGVVVEWTPERGVIEAEGYLIEIEPRHTGFTLNGPDHAPITSFTIDGYYAALSAVERNADGVRIFVHEY